MGQRSGVSWLVETRHHPHGSGPQEKERQQPLLKTKTELVLMLLQGRYWGPSFDVTLHPNGESGPPPHLPIRSHMLQKGPKRKFLRGGCWSVPSSRKQEQTSPEISSFEGLPWLRTTSTGNKYFCTKCWVQSSLHSTWRQMCFSLWADPTFQYADCWRSRTTVRRFLLY